MKISALIPVFVCAALLAACAPTPGVNPSASTQAANGPAAIPSTETPVPTDTAVPATPRPSAVLAQDAVLYSGPGNANFDGLGTLKTGDPVTLLGVYGDFALVEAKISDSIVTGYLHKNDLGSMPGDIPAVSREAVPLSLLYIPYCSVGAYDFGTDTLTFTNTGGGYFDPQTEAIKLDAPLIIRIGKLSAVDSSYSLVKVMGKTGTQDPWWKGIIRMDIANDYGRYLIGVRDGTTEGYTAQWDLPISSSQPIQIAFDQPEGKSFTILDGDGQVIEKIDLTGQPQLNLPEGLFPQGVVYIGTSTEPHSSSMVTGLQVGVVPDGKWVDQPYSGPGLAELAQKYGLTIGTAFSIWDLGDTRGCRILKREINLAAFADFSWKGYWLGPGEYDFSMLDQEVDYAAQMGWRARAMHLVWGATESDVIPDWLLNGSFTRDQYLQILEQHIKTLVGRYKGRIQEWSIANEAPGRSFYTGSDFWNDKIGPEYIEMAFRWAREADPDGILIFNQDNNESPRDGESSKIIEKMYTTVADLKAKNVPIDVVGMQMHLFLPWNARIAPEKADVIATMKRFADLGVRIYITEMDVDLTRVPGTQAEKWEYQAGLYRNMLEACLESQVCDSFTTWGISDAASWITCTNQGCVNEPEADPLMFDRDFNPKPAYFAVRDVLMNFPLPGTP